MVERYDAVVIGAGPGGHSLAEHAARCGARVAIIEKSHWGGTCTHRGCIPTKALLACSRRYADIRKLKRMGISAGEPAFDFPAMKRHQQQMVKLSALGVEKSLREAGVDLKRGKGEILSPREIRWTDPEGNHHPLQTRRVVIAWGSEPLLLPGIAPSGRVLTSDGFLELERLPDSVIIVGGSVIGVEFATFLAELGVKVTLVEMMERILPLEDEEASAMLKQDLARLGAVIHTSAKLEGLEERVDGVQMIATHREQALTLTADCALVCTGRKPRLQIEELIRLGIRHDPKGILADEDQMTNIPDVYAIGDVTGGMMLAHRAMQQGRALASALYGDRSIVYREEDVPSVVYSHPQVARVGLTEQQARQQGMLTVVCRSEYAANIIARAELMGQGFVKMLFHQDRLVGATILGDNAADMIPAMSLALSNGLGQRELKKWIIPHPTLSEMMTIA